MAAFRIWQPAPCARKSKHRSRRLLASAAVRDEVVSRIIATTTGIDTLAVKAHSIALTSTGPDQTIDEVRRLREELNAYTAGLEEVQQHLRLALPEVS